MRIRPEGTANPELATGDIDIVADEIVILNPSRTPPFYINRDEGNLDEALRMRHRYLDLRREAMQAKHPAAAQDGEVHPRLSRSGRIHRDRNADSLQNNARRRA